MGTKHDDRCLERADDDEPIFVLRAQDCTSVATVGYWLGSNPQLSPERKEEATQQVRHMIAWQKDHPDRVKRPD